MQRLVIYLNYSKSNTPNVSLRTPLLSANSFNHNFIVFINKFLCQVSRNESTYRYSALYKLNLAAFSHTARRLSSFFLEFTNNDSFSLTCSAKGVSFYIKL